MERRLAELTELADALHRSMEEGDHSRDLAEQHNATQREAEHLARLLAEARDLEMLPDDPAVVEIGDTVTVRLDDGTEEEYVIVHPIEAAVDDRRISTESPLATALLGQRVGDDVEVVGPAGSYHCRILAARRAGPEPSP